MKYLSLKSVTSTNDVAINLIKEKNKFWMYLFNLQTKGRGTYGKKWISEKGNLFAINIFSLKKIIHPFE